jgi:arylsulfatase A-like enzyme
MPLLMRFPGRIQPGRVDEHIVTNLDFAPTFLELSGVPIPKDKQGLSLAGLIKDEPAQEWRDAIYYHYYEYPSVHMAKRHFGIRTKKYKLIHFYYDIDRWELYDLENDPKELNNVYNNPLYSETAGELKSKLNALQKKYGDSKELAEKFLKQDLSQH